MAGMCNHTICRGNKCIGNNGCGICLFGDDSPEHKFAAFHWVLENNVVSDNRWGIYMEYADWIDMAGNVLEEQPRRRHHQGGREHEHLSSTPTIRRSPSRPRPSWWRRRRGQAGPAGAGQAGPAGGIRRLGQHRPRRQPAHLPLGLQRRHDAPPGPASSTRSPSSGRHSVGLTVNNGRFSDLAYRDFLVYEDVQEFGTEGQAGQWSWTEVQPAKACTYPIAR